MSKGEETRERILDRAFLLAGRDGFDGLTIGALADELKMSKSGLFAHFGSKEELQVAVLDLASSRFTERVMIDAFKAPRGLPRLKRVFENWVAWGTDPRMPGGCIFTQAHAELDDVDGRPREVLAESERVFQEALAKTVKLAVDEGHFKKGTDCEQFAFELEGILKAMHMFSRLLRDRRAAERARTAFERLVASHRS
ncbi:MAG: TetR/AcrR family transcriptional regulator [Archangium sp.]